jgi:hypothetical protein
VRALIEDGEQEQAAIVARLAVRVAEAEEHDALLELLGEITSAPGGWVDALEDFAKSPSEEAWNDLMRFVPEEVFHQRLQYTVLALISLGCDGDVLFTCVSRFGMITELFDLAWSGRVDPETVVARANGSPAEGSWLGLAAIAAFARNDREAALRHAWRASRLDPVLSYASICEIRERADAAFNAELDRADVLAELP